MGRSGGVASADAAFMTVPVLEAYLRAEIEAGSIDGAFEYYERLLRRKRVPHQTVCTQLLQLCAMHAPRRCTWVLETMGEARGLDVDDYTRIVRLFIMQRVSTEQLKDFEELGLDLLTFPDEGMHAYFAHVTTLLNLELHEQISSRNQQDIDVSLITHQRQTEAVTLLCKRGSMVTPQFHLLLAGMGGREGAQSEAELSRLASEITGLASQELISAAQAHLATLPLNPSQRRAADAALDRRLTLVQGPPGTGKTATSVQILTLWVRQLQIRPVLACADSNVAVDNMAVALVASGLSIVRAGRMDAIRSDLHQFMPEALGGTSAIGAADIVLCTCIGAGAESFKKLTFAAVLIDETAQSTEPSCLVPLMHGCRQLVLVGDHKQLRPTVVSEEAARRGLKRSMFERLLRLGVEPYLLDTQYRMHPSLALFPSKEFYGGRYQSGVTSDDRPQLKGFTWPRSSFNVALVLSNAAEDASSSMSKRNSGEAHTIVSIVRSILSAGEIGCKDIGIVTPYTAQVALLRQLCAGLPQARALEINSVDGFQGREKELILFSAVRSGSRSMGFVADERRLNVLLTRGRRGLIVVGDPRTLVNSTHWADWLQWVQDTGVVYDSPRWRMPERPRSRIRPDSDDEEFQVLGRFLREGDSSDDESGLPTNLKVGGGKGMLTRKAQRESRRAAAAAAAAAAGGDTGSSTTTEEAAWKQTLLQAARAEEDQRALTKETARISQLLLAVANTQLEPPPPPEELRPTPPSVYSSQSGRIFDFKGKRGLTEPNSEGSGLKRQQLSVTAYGPCGEALLPNWLGARNDMEGIVYFFNSATLESCWEPPLRWPIALKSDNNTEMQTCAADRC